MIHKFLELVESIPPTILFILSIIFVTFADYIGKKWSLDQRSILLFIACTCSMLSGFFYYPILLKQGLVLSSVIWTILSIVAFIFIGFVLFHESVTVLQVFGIALGIVSVILLSI